MSGRDWRQRDDREEPRLPWDPPAGDAGATALFLALILLLVGVGFLLYFGTSLLFPD